MRQNLVLDQVLGKLTGSLVSDVVVGEIEFDERGVEHESGRNELEEIVVEQIAGEIELELSDERVTNEGEVLRSSEISRASVNLRPTIFFLY